LALVFDGGAAQAATRKLRARARRLPPARMPLAVAGVAVPFEDECKHFKFIGITGTGKSTVIRELLHAALYRGDRAVIADPDGKTGRLNQSFFRGNLDNHTTLERPTYICALQDCNRGSRIRHIDSAVSRSTASTAHTAEITLKF
jgi:hypothetical protein